MNLLFDNHFAAVVAVDAVLVALFIVRGDSSGKGRLRAQAGFRESRVGGPQAVGRRAGPCSLGVDEGRESVG